MGMNREHLYKAKRVNWRELPKEEWWVEGYYFCMTHTDGRHSHHFIIPLGADLSLGTPIEKIQVEVIAETVCEYTQMTDINKNKIWENDIVLVEHSKLDKETDNTVFMPDIIEYTRNYAIEFVNKGSHCGYRCRNKSIHFAISGNTVYNHKITAIGNIFDNPEFLQND